MCKKLAFIFPFVVFFSNLNAQKTIYVKDSLSKELLKDVQIISEQNEVFYTNDDGAVFIPNNSASLHLSNPSYYSKKTNVIKDTVFLSPRIINIEEVVITNKNYDLVALIRKVFDNYKKNYATGQGLYKGLLKQKGTSDKKIYNILVADLNIWMQNTFYNFLAKKIDDFVNVNINDIKYYKSKSKTDNFNDIQLKPIDFVSSFFMNSRLNALNHHIYNNKSKVKCNVVFEDQDYQRINYSYQTEEDIVSGYILYQKTDNVITSFALTAIYKTSIVTEKINQKGDKYTTHTNKADLFYDFYKKDGKYYPAKSVYKLNGYNLINNSQHQYSLEQSLVFQKQESTKKGLKNKIDLSKPLTENIPTKEVATAKTLLSAEEQKFVDEP